MYSLGLIGFPVNQSKSPQIHQHFLSSLQLEGQYNLYEVEEVDLESQLNQLIDHQLTGFNVTIPYKEKIIPLIDDLDQTTKSLKSVNTVKIEGTKLVGYNTDGVGYVESLRQGYPDFYQSLNQQSILILGAGGAAKGIYYTLQNERPYKLDIANRSVNRAEHLTCDYTNSHALSLLDAEAKLNDYDLIIQTTSVGMEPNTSHKIIKLNQLKENTIVSDIIYKPKYTNFLKEAENRGARILFGESMLWYQAAKAFEIWTGYKVTHLVPIKEGD
ncbi:shikimate dehydrogenase [Aquisalibacillus elongatus]|uniref:Shikimate dehydrogenase (NADP(+)) n=1 Tax=Aquisalibacillus elongatus TaxID=485577 RepID=A0A3N5CED6_9BACI|nr:shikimate dehydrogenase [Aquisalibacillus elongatus]RPF55561.1 shikimate dehydrogenase [Aquisalibacillus elongatus]